MMFIDYTVDNMGKMVNIEAIDEEHKLFDFAIEAREKMIEQLSNYDEHLGDLYLSEEIKDIKSADIDEAIRKATFS